MIFSDFPNVRLRLSSDERCLPVIGHLLSGVAACLELDALAASDVGTAVAEACKNVVIHAYEGSEGPLELEVRTAPDMLEVLVRDDGIGIRPHLGERTRPHNGIGLPIVHLLTKQLVYTNIDGGGTELRMRFELPGVQPLPAAPDPELDFRELPLDTVTATLAPALLSRFALAPLIAAISIRAGCGEEATRTSVPGFEVLAAGTSEEGVSLRGQFHEGGGLELSVGPVPAATLQALPEPWREDATAGAERALFSLPGA